MAEGTGGADHERTPGEIARAISRGEPQAETWLIDRFQRPVRILLRNWGHLAAEAEDLTQETLLAVLRRLRNRELADPDGLSAFVQSTARQIGANSARLQRRRREILERDYAPGLSDSVDQPDQLVEDMGLRRALLEALRQIRIARDRTLLLEHYVHGTPKVELCARLDLSPAHFDRVLYNARTRLRIEMQRRGVRWP